MGLQAAVIEFTRYVPLAHPALRYREVITNLHRNIMNWKEANTTENDPSTAYPVIIDMPEHNTGQLGGTMRLGKRKTIFHGDSTLSNSIKMQKARFFLT